jgi:hypothetical protein
MAKINETELKGLVRSLREYMAEADPANAKEQNYATALQQIKGLYAKAQVPYPPTDKILQSRYGLPDALPPMDQWDGTMPKSTGADFLTRNLFGRQASADVAKAQTVNDLSNAGSANADAAVAADMAKLTALVGKLKALGATPAAAAPAASAEPAVPGVKAGGEVVDTRGGLGGVDEMEESTTYFLNKLRLIEELAAPAAAPTPAAGGEDKASIIKQIQDIIADINAQNENPPQDVIKALSDAQAAIDAANAAPTGSAALDGTKPGANPATTIPGGPGTAAGAPVTDPVKTVAKKTWAKGVLGAGMSGPEVKELQGKLIAAGYLPAGADDGSYGKNTRDAVIALQTDLGVAKDGAYGPVTKAAFDANPEIKKGGTPPVKTVKESVSYGEDQALARIVSLARF